MLAVIPNSRFIGMAGISSSGAPASVTVVTVREAVGGNASLLEGWPLSGANTPAQTRSITWATDYRVQGIGSNQIVTYIAGRSALSITAEEISPANLARVGVATSLTTVSNTSDAGVARMNVLGPSVAPVFVWVNYGSTLATLHRMETQNIFVTALTSPGLVQPDDVIDVPLIPMMPNRLLATARCTDTCSYATNTNVATGLVGRVFLATYSPTQPMVFGPTIFSALVDTGGSAVFDSASAIRAAFDGTSTVYLAGQGTNGSLVVQRMDSMTGALSQQLFTSSGPLRLVDMVRAQNGTGVYLLVTYQQQVTFGSRTLLHSMGNLGNVAVIRIDSMAGTVTESQFDLPLDQQAVAFARSAGFLYIALQEGPNAVLWRIPAP